MSHRNARVTDFINTWPLYSLFRLQYTQPAPPLELPKVILRYCKRCSATPTWSMLSPNSSSDSGYQHIGVGFVTRYRCTHCREEEIRLWLDVDNTPVAGPNGANIGYIESIIRKLGQWPPQDNAVSPEVEKGLPPEAVPLYRKGLTSLTHGYGLGALGYFRRVVEDSTSYLIDLFAKQAEERGEGEAAAAVRIAGASSHMEDRLRAAATALPESIRPGGVNPLSALYSQYSRGIHGLSDDECLMVAQRLQFALDYIFRQWRSQMREADAFRSQIQEWSNPNSTPEARG